MPLTTRQRLELKTDKRNGSCGLVRILSPWIRSNGITACGACLPSFVRPFIRVVAWSPFFSAVLCEDPGGLPWSLVMFFFFLEGGLSQDLRRVCGGEAVEPKTKMASQLIHRENQMIRHCG